MVNKVNGVLVQWYEYSIEEKTPGVQHSHRLCSTRMQWENTVYKPRRGLGKHSVCWHLDLGLPASSTVRKYISVAYATLSVVFCYCISSKLLLERLTKPESGSRLKELQQLVLC
jgi:hypothetical protein